MKISKLKLIEKFKGYVNLKEVTEYYNIPMDQFEYIFHSIKGAVFKYFVPIVCERCRYESECIGNHISENFKFLKFKEKDVENQYPYIESKILYFKICKKYQKK